MYKLYQGDYLEIMKGIESGSIDMILCDLPYGTTDCKWDYKIHLDAEYLKHQGISYGYMLKYQKKSGSS